MKEVLASFGIQFQYDNAWHDAFIKTCCKEDDMFYYDVWINDQFQFSLTRSDDDLLHRQADWKIALVNADNNTDPELVDAVGQAIDRHLEG